MEMRFFYFVVGSALCFYHINGFIFTKYIENISKSASVVLSTRLQARGFSKEEKLPKLSKDAAKYLKESKGVLEVAQGRYFQSKLLSLKLSDPLLFEKLEAYKPNNIHSDESAMQAHEKLVEYTWDTIAAYLPLIPAPPPSSTTSYNGNGSIADLTVSKKLEIIAQATCFRADVSVMDVGCGNGGIIPYLQRAGADLKSYFGVDVSSQMIETAKLSHPGLVFEKLNFLNSSPPQKVDVVLLNGVIQFFPSIPEALRRAASMLKPCGRVVIAHANGAAFVRGERRGNPNTVLNDMPDPTFLQAVGEEIGAGFIGLQDIVAGDNNYNLDDMYVCVLQMRQ